MIDVENPTTFDDRDNAVIQHVDSFLRERRQYSIATVSNTIFPQALYEKHGSPKFYGEYQMVFRQLAAIEGLGSVLRSYDPASDFEKRARIIRSKN